MGGAEETVKRQESRGFACRPGGDARETRDTYRVARDQATRCTRRRARRPAGAGNDAGAGAGADARRVWMDENRERPPGRGAIRISDSVTLPPLSAVLFNSFSSGHVGIRVTVTSACVEVCDFAWEAEYGEGRIREAN
jgi:hypothetical protein